MWHCSTLSNWIASWHDQHKQPPVPAIPLVRPHLAHLAQLPETALPDFVRHCPVAMKYLHLLGGLDWEHFPERPGGRAWPGHAPAPRAAFAAAFLVKVEEGHRHLGQLRRYLVEHPALVWVLGFPLKPSPTSPWGFDADASLPSRKHLGRVLRELPNASLQVLLSSSVTLIQDALPPDVNFGDTVAVDTKHIIAWVKQNNPKAYVKDRFDKHCQPKGDPDCKLGCKRKDNRRPQASDSDNANQGESAPGQPADHEPTHTEPPPAPTAAPASTAPSSEGTLSATAPTCDGKPASTTLPPLAKGEFYWGYASGVVATKVREICECVLAEFTQTFDHADVSYFHPLMARTEHNLGRAPRYGALDKAFDAFYVYQYFLDAGGFAAVPLADRSDHKKTFNAQGLPLCPAGLAMPLRSTFFQKSFCLVPHQVGRYACPLLFPKATAETCPLAHVNWPKGGCITSLPTCLGNRVRHQLDRNSQEYKLVYNQRTAVERINSQALELGIERPHLRNGAAIANSNTLIYIVINLHALQRIHAQTQGSRQVTMHNN